eukprot:403339178
MQVLANLNLLKISILTLNILRNAQKGGPITPAPIKKEDIPKIKQMIESIEEGPNAEPFLEPVQWQELGLVDYPQIIKRPMDFSTVKINMENGKLKTYDEVFSEIQLIWDNCKTYNMAGSDIYKLAEYMEKITKRTVQKFKSQMGINTAPTTSLLKKAPPKDNKKSVRINDDNQDGEEEEDITTVTVEMKMDFVEKVKKLDNQGLTKMVSHIQTLMPSSLSDLEDERLQIKIDDFDRDTFKKINDFIDEILLNSQPSKRQRTQ